MKAKTVSAPWRLSLRLLAATILALLALIGCSPNFSLSNIWDFARPATSTPAVTATIPASAPSPEPTASQPTGPQTLILWVPPQFDPAGDSDAAVLLRGRLDRFTSENADIRVQVRVKAASGPGGLLDALSVTASAAPDALPSLVLMERSDLESAAVKELILPLDGLTTSVDDADWYDYAQELSLVQGSRFGIPFAGDALVLLYRPQRITTPPQTWSDILSRGEPLAFAPADPQATAALALYQSAGGLVEDVQGRPNLDAKTLAEVLGMFADGAKGGSFPAWLAEMQDDSQVWQLYRDQRTPWMIGWTSRYLTSLPADTNLTLLPSQGEKDFALATGWLWALTERQPDRQAAAVRLAEYLTASDFLTTWTEQAGYLPPRPSSLAGWQNQSLSTLLSRVVSAAQVRPRNELTASLGPVMSDATLTILEGRGEPAQVAQESVDRLGAP